jgi:hypothetical protein
MLLVVQLQRELVHGAVEGAGECLAAASVWLTQRGSAGPGPGLPFGRAGGALLGGYHDLPSRQGTTTIQSTTLVTLGRCDEDRVVPGPACGRCSRSWSSGRGVRV